jgi:uncharacterized protein
VSASAELHNLLALQDLDTHIDQERHRRVHLPERDELGEIESGLAHTGAQHAEAAAALEEIAARQAVAERELRSTEQRIAQVNSRLYGGGVSASRELQAMAADVDGLRKRASELEDRALAAMEEREPLDNVLAGLDERSASLLERQKDVQDKLAAAERDVDAQLARLVAERPRLARAVPGELLRDYERLRTRLGGVAVARLIGGRCDGCHLSLPAVELDRIRHQSSGKLEHCEQCGRVLVILGE